MDSSGDDAPTSLVPSLQRTLGTELLRYVLTIDEGVSLDGLVLTEFQVQTVLALRGWAGLQPGATGGVADFMQVSALSQYVDAPEASVVNILRQMSGGAVESAQASGDPLVDALAELAADIWPVYLARPSGEVPATFWMSTPIGLYSHPAAARAVGVFLKDPELMKLFPFPPSEASPEPRPGLLAGMGYDSLIVGNGQSGSLSLTNVVAGLVSGAAFRLLMTGAPLSLSGMVPHLISAVAQLKDLAQGREVQVPALVGLAGLTLPEGAPPLVLPHGRLRRATNTDRELFLGGSLSFQTVLETTFPSRVYSVREHKFDDQEDPFADMRKYETRIQAAYRTFAHSLDLVRLSLLLASPVEAPWLAREVARFVSDLTSTGGSRSWSSSSTGTASYELPVGDYSKVQQWLLLVTQKHSASLDIGMRRLLSAATSRSDPIDGFVDAVICWESLFGVQTETSFRVTASIAKLLESKSVKGRDDLHKELKALYGKRSRLVHGGPEPSPEEIEKLKKRAVEIAAACLRAFYQERDDLIPLASETRGARILLE